MNQRKTLRNVWKVIDEIIAFKCIWFQNFYKQLPKNEKIKSEKFRANYSNPHEASVISYKLVECPIISINFAKFHETLQKFKELCRKSWHFLEVFIIFLNFLEFPKSLRKSPEVYGTFQSFLDAPKSSSQKGGCLFW